MKQLHQLTRMLTASLFASLIIIGCKKEKSDTLTPTQEEEAANFSFQSETESDIVFNDIFNNVMGINNDLGVGGTGVFERAGISSDATKEEREMDVDSLPSCVTVTITQLNLPNMFPVKVVLDFGTGCTSNGHTRSGKIITVYTGRLVVPGSSATTSFENFKMDSISVQGTHVIKNTTALGSNQRQFTVDVENAKLTRPNGNYSQWDSHRVITQIEGNATIFPQDDIFRIAGGAHGRVKRGNLLYGWQSEIVEPLIRKFFCPWISKGVLRVRRETLPSTSPWVASLNFGTGTCDYFATLTLNGITHQIELPH